MINAIFRPIDKWPSEKTAADKRRRSPFKAAYNATLDLLEAELQHLYASDIVIQCEAQRSQIRNDGWLKSDARVEGPAVIVSFNSRWEKSYGYPCDRFTDWKANLRAIALSLEALRAVDRYGVTTHGQQYQGFLRLAAAESRAERNPALEALAQLSGVSLNGSPSSDEINAAYKAAARRCHPDTGGSADAFATLQAVMQVLRPSKGANA
jgi:hypothetical protein